MKCSAVQRALSAGQGEERRSLTSSRIRRHLDTCATCRQVQAELDWLTNCAVAWRNDAPPPALQGRISQALQDVAAPVIPIEKPVGSPLSWIVTLKENTTMKRRIGFAGFVLLLAAGGLMTTSLPRASARTRLAEMKKAMQNVRTAHLSIWENTSLPNRQFYQRELWVQGDLLRQYVPGQLWMISSPDTNWYYIADTDQLKREAHTQKPVKFDFSQTLSNLEESHQSGKGNALKIESGSDTILRGRQVAQIWITEIAPTPEQLAEEQAQAERAAQEQAERNAQKGLPPPVMDKQATPATSLHSRRSLYWVDKATDLPLHSEEYVETNGKWALERRTDYFYDEQFPAHLFDPQDLLRVGRQERIAPSKAH